jgi:bifunctional DNase/RNase
MMMLPSLAATLLSLVAAAPPEWVVVEVAAVMPMGEAHTMVLANRAEHVMVPVRIALPEAVALFARMQRGDAPQHLTHDVIDELVSSLGAAVTRVELTVVDDDVVAVVLLRRGDGSTFQLTARPSDAVAMALGSHTPIRISRELASHGHALGIDKASTKDHADAAASANERVGIREL